jgi:peptide/nickel transport system substrate-binding protein
VEVRAFDFAGDGSDVVSDFAFQAGGDGRMKRHKNSFDKMTNGKAIAVAMLCLGFLLGHAVAQDGGELRFCLRTEPKTFDPLKVEDDASASIRYLTGGVLVRVNRQTQELEPGLAVSWKVSKDGRHISFRLRSGILFSDGTPFSAEDVAYTVQQLMDPALHSPTGDAFRSGTGTVETNVISPTQIAITFPAQVASLDRLFDQVAILSAHSSKKEMAVLGPFVVADYKPGSSVLLKRNPNYWKTDEQGRKLPYLDSIRLDVQPNRDVELLRFKRGELDLINSLDSEYFDKLAGTSPQLVHDAGASLDSEQLWFNEVAKSPIPSYKKNWFRSASFRRAISEAINREDLSRVVFHSHAQPAVGPFSPANKFWFNSKLKPQAYNSDAALKSLQDEGFRMENGTLKDKDGNEVVFSIITNAGNKYRERMAVLIQDDLQKIGIHVNVVTLDFPSLIERMTQTFDYEAIILGLTNVDLDPNGEMNVWLSSSENHQWNPQQKAPETAWEAEIDRLMRAQASSSDPKKRKEAFDRVQEIAVEQEPFIFLINKNALSAVSTAVHGAAPVILSPQTFWNAERLTVAVK